MTKIPPFEIIRASRRSISIEISPTKGLIVRAPFSIPEDIIHAFVDKKADWISKHLSKLREKREEKGNMLYYLGQAQSFEYNLAQKEAVIYADGLFSFSSKTKEQKTEQTCLTNWYRKQARECLTQRVDHYAQKYGFSYKQIRINSAMTRWGSCSAHNNLNFPWRLMMAPPEIVDYVVVHELAHTVHKNHGLKFWKLVESIEPEWRTYRTYLRKDGWKYSLPSFHNENGTENPLHVSTM